MQQLNNTLILLFQGLVAVLVYQLLEDMQFKQVLMIYKQKRTELLIKLMLLILDSWKVYIQMLLIEDRIL